MNYNNIVIGERIKTARCNPFNGAPGYSQGNLAVALGLDSTSRTTIRKWERGEVLPPLDHLLKMCELFGCELGYLLGEHDLPTRTATDIQKETGLSNKAINSIQQCAEKEMLDMILSSDRLNYFLSCMADAIVAESHSIPDPGPGGAVPMLIPSEQTGYFQVHGTIASGLFWNMATDTLKHIGKNILRKKQSDELSAAD